MPAQPPAPEMTLDELRAMDPAELFARPPTARLALTVPYAPYAPRPLYRAALLRYYAGTLAGPRHHRGLSNQKWYRQNRRRRPAARQFHASNAEGTIWAPGIIPTAPWPYDLGKKIFGMAYWEPDTTKLITDVLALLQPTPCGQRAIIARPLWSDRPARRLRDSRARPAALHGISGDLGTFVALRPRRRTRYAVPAGAMIYLAARRYMANICKRQGMRQLRPGVYMDDLADVMFAQQMAPAGELGVW